VTQPELTVDILLTLAVAAGALGLFLWNRLRVDVVGLIVMVSLILLGLVTPQEGISGFANEATVTVAAMFILSAGLLRTGAIDVLGRWVARLAGSSELRLLLVACLLVVPMSAFINNTPVVVVMIPLILGLTRELGIAPSRLFMPISFASQMGGTLTLIGTSTNLLVAGLVLELGLERIRLFDITGPALVLTLIGLAYLFTVGRWLTPTRQPAADVLDRYEIREYLSVLVVEEESPLAGQSLRESRFGEMHGLEVVGIERSGQRLPVPGPETAIAAGDLLLVHGKLPDLARIAEVDHLRIAGTKPELRSRDGDGDEGNGDGDDEGEERVAHPPPLAELIVPPRSPVVGRSLRQLAFRGRYGVPVLAIQRHGQPLHERIRDIALEPGDIMLVEGTAAQLRQIHRSGDLALLGPVDLPAKRIRKIKYSVPILLGVVLLAATGVTTILVSALLGVIAMFVTGSLTPEEAYREVDWMVIVLLGSLIPLGLAMQNSGAAEYVAAGLLRLTTPLGLLGILATFYLLTSVITGLISNNAAAIVLTPIAVGTALALEVSPMPFVIAVMFAASNSFLTPIGYQTNTFVWGPGGYRFGDFFRVGAPLSVLLLIAATLVIPVFFPFHP
jgi:di/tricarboxylate transporter